MEPKAKLSQVIGRYFDAWICRDTWDSRHPLDDQCFYRFVKAVARYSRCPPRPSDVKNLIVQKRGAGQISSALRKAADEFEDLYETLLAYEKTRDFPDALIERTDIVRYHLKLTLGKGSNDAHVNRTMTNVWGRDWRVRLNRAIGVLR
jgi:hypothetical protein